MSTLTQRIERRLEAAGVPAAAEEVEGAIVLTGMVTTDEEHQAVLDIAEEEAPPDLRIEDNIETTGMLAADIAGLSVRAAGSEPMEPSQPETRDDAFNPGDFEDQRLLKNPLAASGPSDNTEDDLVGEGDVAYVPPTDPVKTRDDEVLGGFQVTSMDRVRVARSSDGELGDEAIADAVRRELEEDAATNGLTIDVSIAEAIVTLRGRVPDVVDSENAEEVASRVPGVVEVNEQLEIESLQ